MASAIDVMENLQKCFPPPGPRPNNDADFLRWCNLGSFLSDPDRVLPQIEKLDVEMFAKLCGRVSVNLDNLEDQVPLTTREDCAKYKPFQKTPPSIAGLSLDKRATAGLLTATLAASEKKQGFKSAVAGDKIASVASGSGRAKGGEKLPTYHGFVDAAQFRRQLAMRMHWKDPGAGSVHGEFTHRIQWYAVGKGLFADGEMAADVFSSIGHFSGTRQWGKFTLTLWDALCDRFNFVDPPVKEELLATEGFGKRSMDFRSPENLHMFLKDNSNYERYSWPLLNAFLKARYDKRDQQGKAAFSLPALTYAKAVEDYNWLEHGFQYEYLANKVYRKSYINLEPLHQRRIDRIAKRRLSIF